MGEIVYPRHAKPFKDRLKIIADGVVAGLSKGEIARRCGVTERTNYNDRQSVEYISLYNALFDLHIRELVNYARKDEKGAQRFVLAQRNRLLERMLPRRIEAKAEVVHVIIRPVWDPRIANSRKFVDVEQKRDNDGGESSGL